MAQTRTIQSIYNDSLELKHIADAYCKARGIENPDFGYLKFLQFNNRVMCEVIVIPVRDAKGKIVMLELRSVKFKEHYKLVDDPSYHIYNIQNAIHNTNYVVLTEGVFDAETIIQRGYNAVSTLSASIPATARHMLTAFDHIIIAFDNDGAGVRASRELVDFMRQNYPESSPEVLEYGDKDLNESLASGGIDLATKELDTILTALGVA